MSEPVSATVIALLWTLSRSPIPAREKLAALENATHIVRASAEEAERAELELLWAVS
jgi:hypothetical protein